jgi:hypothetical protein
LLRELGAAISTVEMGKAMLAGAGGLSEKRVLNTSYINVLAARP